MFTNLEIEDIQFIFSFKQSPSIIGRSNFLTFKQLLHCCRSYQFWNSFVVQSNSVFFTSIFSSHWIIVDISVLAQRSPGESCERYPCAQCLPPFETVVICKRDMIKGISRKANDLNQFRLMSYITHGCSYYVWL